MMKSGAQDSAEGRLRVLKGSGREMVGKVIGDDKLEREGKVRKRAGRRQEKIGQMKKILGK